MTGAVAIIGWGSLIWDPDNLAPHLRGDWRMGGGPRIPLEFTRISPKRKMGLALCIDPAHGAPCPSHAIASRRADAVEARADLAARERAPLDLIGMVCLRTGRAEGRNAALFAEWCAATGFAGAVWTDLRPNFADHAGVAFSLERAEAHLLSLTGASRDEAVRYIHNAPPDTDTPLRRRLAARDWWRADLTRLELRPPGPDAPQARGRAES